MAERGSRRRPGRVDRASGRAETYTSSQNTSSQHIRSQYAGINLPAVNMGSLSHFDSAGASRMVDVSGKDATLRVARASGRVQMEPATLALIRDQSLAKGNVLEVARLAGIMAAKRTSDLIPLCHAVPLASVEIAFDLVEPGGVQIETIAKAMFQTGVEMEALVAVSTAALTIYDMCKSVDRGMSIVEIHLKEKSGGQSGHFLRPGELPPR